MEAIKKQLNEDCISVILSFIDISAKTLVKEAKEKTLKLYMEIITRTHATEYTEGKIYMTWHRGGWIAGNRIDENAYLPRLLFFRVERKTKKQVTLRLIYDERYNELLGLQNLVVSEFPKRKKLYINENRTNGEYWVYRSMNYNDYNIYADSCYEYDKFAHAQYRYKYANELDLLYGIAEGKWTGATTYANGVIA